MIKALGTLRPAERDELLSLAGRVGGQKLIGFVAGIAASKDPDRRKLGIDALSKWPDASVADKLLEITSQAADPAERSQAFGGYVKVSATRDQRTDAQRLDRMKQAMALARTSEERSLVINRCRTAYAVETLRFVLPYLEQPAFAQMACETIVELAHHREIRDPNKAEFDKALDKVIADQQGPSGHRSGPALQAWRNLGPPDKARRRRSQPLDAGRLMRLQRVVLALPSRSLHRQCRAWNANANQAGRSELSPCSCCCRCFTYRRSGQRYGCINGASFQRP